MKYLYHASKVPDIKVLKPYPNNAVDGERVVFSIEDPLFAVAMTYGSGDQIAVGYYMNQDTDKKTMYIDEIEKGALELLDNECFLYKVESIGFKNDDRIMKEELINYQEVPVVDCAEIVSALSYLNKNNVEIVKWEDVPTAMSKRNKNPRSPKKTHKKDRFKQL